MSLEQWLLAKVIQANNYRWQSNNGGIWVTEASISPFQALKEGLEIRIYERI